MVKLNSPTNFKHKQGFTLIELLVVIGILAVLLAITLIAINPARQFAQANNTARRSDVNVMLNAVNQYMVDNKGTLPPGISGITPGVPINVSEIDAAGNTGETGTAFCNAIVPTYIAAMPADPQGGTYQFTSCANYNTGYRVSVSTASAGQSSRITITSANPELGTTISVTR